MGEKFVKLFEDEAFVAELGKAESAEAAQAVFKSKGVDISIDELKALKAALKQEAGEELTDEELALIAGGHAVMANVNFGGPFPLAGLSNIRNIIW